MQKLKPTDGVAATGHAGPTKRITEHPLQQSEMTFSQRQDQLDMALLRRSVGMHLPLRLQAERKCLANAGHLPFLVRHESALNALTGRDELIGFDDFLGHAEDAESVGQPHVIVERSNGF